MQKILLGLLLSLIISTGFAQQGESQPLPSDQAFIFSTYVDEHDNIIFQWNIAPGYYLYRNKFSFSLSPMSNLKIGKIAWPAGLVKTGNEGDTHPIYSGLLKLTVPLLGAFRGPITLAVTYQGCSMNGFCYAPVAKHLHVDLATIKPSQNLTGNLTENVAVTSANTPFLSDQNTAEKIFAGHGIVFILLSFLGLGLLLAFTPCVLPMIPILSGIIIGHRKHVATSRAFCLSLAYVLGMAITYAIAGVIVALLGSSIQTLFQKTWVIASFSGLFVLLALSLFGFYELQLPSKLHQHTTRLSNRLEGGSLIGVFLMGCLSTLIVSPCVSAPLVGVLAYIAQTGNTILGGAALLMLGFGMGIPLLLIGTSASKWLPKAGQWMDLVKKLFGILMLGIAIWMLSRIFSGPLILFLWSMLCVGTGLFLSVFYRAVNKRILFRIVGSVLVVYGVILIAGAGLGSSDPLQPWEGWSRLNEGTNNRTLFHVIKNSEELDLELNTAKENKKPIILDFYAKWCVSCVVMDKHVFNRPSVQKALTNFVRLRVDVTENNVSDRTILKRYKVVAPPTILFFDNTGKEVESVRIVGEVNETIFLNKLNKAKELDRAK